MKTNRPWILIYDIETSPIIGYVWGLWENNLALNQIEKDWEIISFSAKWYQDPKTKVVYGPHNNIIYMDQRDNKEIINDPKLLKPLHSMMDEADVILTQNGVSFDNKKVSGKFIEAGLPPPSPSKQLDTKKIASSTFGFTSNKLEYMTEKFNEKYKKLKNSGMSLWIRCMKGDLSAWKEMEKYNKYDILSLQELFSRFLPWVKTIDFNLYSERNNNKCNCGSDKLNKRGFAYTTVAKYQRYTCMKCGTWFRGKTNLLTKTKRSNLLTKI